MSWLVKTSDTDYDTDRVDQGGRRGVNEGGGGGGGSGLPPSPDVEQLARPPEHGGAVSLEGRGGLPIPCPPVRSFKG